MMILQFDEKLRRWNCVGVGRVMAKEGKNPLHSVMVNNTEKITFVANCGYTLTAQNLPVSRSIYCAAYNNRWCKELFALVKTLKKGDNVLFAGWVKISQGLNDRGEEVEYKELRLEFLSKINGGIAAGLSNPDVPIYEGSYGSDGLDFN